MRAVPTALVCLVVGSAAGCGPGGDGGVPPAADPADEVMRVHARLNRVNFPTAAGEAGVRAAVSEMNAIDTSRCPPDYQAAVARVASALGAVADLAAETGSWEHQVSTGVESFLRGFTRVDPFAAVREGRERRRQLQARVTEALGHYERTLAKYRK